MPVPPGARLSKGRAPCSHLQTADKLTVEVFDQGEAAGQPLQEAVVSKIVDPAKQAGGDSKLFFPSEKAVKAEEKLVDGQVRWLLACCEGCRVTSILVGASPSSVEHKAQGS